eukprot:5532730-Pyramimonas_sp.AAC.1
MMNEYEKQCQQRAGATIGILNRQILTRGAGLQCKGAIGSYRGTLKFPPSKLHEIGSYLNTVNSIQRLCGDRRTCFSALPASAFSASIPPGCALRFARHLSACVNASVCARAACDIARTA